MTRVRLAREVSDLRHKASILRARSDAPSHELAKRYETRARFLECRMQGFLEHKRESDPDYNPNVRRIRTLAAEAFMDAAPGSNAAEFLRSWMEEKKSGAAVTTPLATTP